MPAAEDTLAEERRIGRIPVRNLWLLMLYASDLNVRSSKKSAPLSDRDRCGRKLCVGVANSEVALRYTKYEKADARARVRRDASRRIDPRGNSPVKNPRLSRGH